MPHKSKEPEIENEVLESASTGNVLEEEKGKWSRQA